MISFPEGGTSHTACKKETHTHTQKKKEDIDDRRRYLGRQNKLRLREKFRERLLLLKEREGTIMKRQGEIKNTERERDKD